MRSRRASELRAMLRVRRGDDEDESVNPIEDFEEDDELDEDELEDEELEEEYDEEEEYEDLEDYDEEFDDEDEQRRGGRPRREWE